MRSELPEELRSDYELVRLLGMGASGSVHLATRRATGRPVAIKLMRLAGSRTAAKRFEREAGSLARISHPALVEHIAHGVAGEDAYLITEYLQGNSLKESRAGVDPQSCMLQVAEALDAIHGAGLIHRDVKPANIMVTPQGRAVLLDLGLVVDPDRTRITRTGTLPGTMNFLPLEVLHGKPFTQAADWYAWGVTYYFLLEGKHPFHSTDIFAAAEGEPLPALRLGEVDPRSGEGWLLRAACHPEASRRPDSADACRRILDGARPVLDTPGSEAQPVLPSTIRTRADDGGRGRHRPFLLGGIFLAASLGMLVMTLGPAESTAPPAASLPPTTSPVIAGTPQPAPRDRELPREIPPEERPPWLELTGKPMAAGFQQTFLAEVLGFRLCPIALVPGERLLFTSFRGEVGILDLGRGEVVARFSEHEGPVQSLDLGPDARWAVLGGDDRRVWRVGVPGLEVQREVDGGSHGIFSVAVAHHGRTFAAAGDGPEVRVWDSETGELVHRLTGHASRVVSLEYQPDDRRLYAGGLAGVIRVWDLETGRAVARIPSDGRTVADMAFDSAGERLVAGYLDGLVRVFDVATGELRATLEGHTQHVASVRFTALDREIFTASWDGDVRVWDGASYQPRGVLEGTGDRVMGLAINSYSNHLVTLDDASVVQLWNPQSRKLVASHQLRHGEVHRLSASRGVDTGGDRLVGVVSGPGSSLVAADVGGAVFLLDAAVERRGQVELSGLHSLGALDGVALLAGEDPAARVMDLASGAPRDPIPGPGGRLTALATHTGTGRLALAEEGGAVAWRDGLGGEPRALSGSPAVPARALVFTADGAGLVAGLEDGQVLYWRRLEDPVPTRLGRHRTPVRAAALAPGQGFLVTAADDGQLYFWDTDEGLLLQTQPAHEDRVTVLRFLPDGRLASAGWDGTVRLTDLAGDGEVEILKGHEGPVEGLAMRRDEELVSAGWDGWLRSWEP